jgi:anti-sigma regulatory factor (Ser/Thr protein kinase)
MVLEKSSIAPRRARRAVQDLLGDDASIQVIRDAILLTSELVTNAIEHSSGGCEVSASFDRRRCVIRVEVSDRSTVKPSPRTNATMEDLGGRGLLIVDRVASRWGSTAAAAGKSVWFEIDSS